MNRKKVFKNLVILGAAVLLIGGGFGLYLFNMPHRDVQATKTDFTLESSQLVAEYLNAAEQANLKYLDEEGDSKVLAVSGVVSAITDDLNNQKVVLLKNTGDKAGVSCTFMESTNAHAEQLAPGQTVTIKGVIRSGAGYDEDLGLYEDVILEKCDIINN
ncbi:MAG: hypothetical protein EPGJADBJ_04341 [Saprospiraceae bacterium]|nr:hypothetical protein [Saprospiraceae bacterium]